MTRIFISALMLFFAAVPGDLQKLRELYPHTSRQENAVAEIQSICEKNKSLSQALKNAYSAAAEMASANYKFNPISKLNTFNNGKKLLEAAVRSDSANVEIRYIRFTIQSNAPAFLGYTKQVGPDKNFLVRNLKTLKNSDTDLYSIIYAYLITNVKLTAGEKQLLK